MLGQMRNYMKVGLISFMAFPGILKGEGHISEIIKKIACDDYFDAIEVSWIKDPEERKRAIQILRTSGMTVAYGAQPRYLTTGLNINDIDEEKRRTALNSLKEGIDEAYEIGAAGFAFMSGIYEESKKDEAYKALVESTNELCSYAKSKGSMRIALEVFDYDVDKKSLIGPAELARSFAGEITREFDNFGLLVDSSHLPLLRETPAQSIIPVKEYIIHAHMGNCVVKDPSLPAYGDYHPRFGFPGSENGAKELAEYLEVLLDIGFLNTENPPIVSFEVKPFGDEDSDIVIANAKRTLNEAWSILSMKKA